jgi:hypothetical protein
VLADGTDVYVSSTNTDQSGLADFALPDLGNAQAYVLKLETVLITAGKPVRRSAKAD